MYAHLLINKNNVRLTFVTVIYLFCCVYVLHEERCPWTNFFLLSGVLQMNLRWILTLHLIYIKLVCPSNWKTELLINKQNLEKRSVIAQSTGFFFFCIVLLLHEFILMIFEMVDRMLLSFFMNKDCCLLSIFRGPIYKVV